MTGDFLQSEYLALWKQWGVDSPLFGSVPRPTLPATKPKPALKTKGPTVSTPVVAPAATPFSSPAPTDLNTLKDLKSLEAVRAVLGECRRCGLCQERKQIVFGSGSAQSPLLFVGEGPGADEDAQGLPFVGKAGGLLTKIIEAMGYQRDAFYIANVVKCRPPENRAPQPEEIAACLPFLRAQIEVIRPRYIIALGLYAATTLTGRSSAISALRGRFHPLQWNPEIQVMPTYHPAYLLRNPAAKKMVWEDVKQVKTELDRMKLI